MSWLKKILPKSKAVSERRRSVPEGVWSKCDKCDQILYRAELERNLEVCPKCDHHMRISARERLLRFLDTDSTRELGAELEPQDILKFRDSKKYKDRISQAEKTSGEKDALIAPLGIGDKGSRGQLGASPVSGGQEAAADADPAALASSQRLAHLVEYKHVAGG